MTLVAVISDTHSRALPEGCVEHLRAADLILHAGDVASAGALAALHAIGPPVRAVYGNVDSADVRAALPERLTVEIEEVRIGMVHDAGRAAGRLVRMRAAFPTCDAVVFGHSHIPLHESRGDFAIFNPGSPTDRRRQPVHTMGLLRVTGTRSTWEHVEV